MAESSDPGKSPDLPRRIRATHGRLAEPDADHSGAEQTSQGEASSGVIHRLLERTSSEDRYRVEDEIGRGGMGVVLEVWDEDLRRRTAMKVATGAGSSGAHSGTPVSELEPQQVARFLEEAQVTGQLEHPGIVPVHELGIDGEGQVYFTMRLVRGRTLEDVFAEVRESRGEWSVTRAVGALLKVCEAMAYAHSKGVIHRDLKPANVMTGEFGEVYVMDWGLVRVSSRRDRHDLRIDRSKVPQDGGRVRIDRGECRSGTDADSLYTMDGDVLGTPSYMATEQARGEVEGLDGRADVYSVGAMLYQLLAGRAPYQSDEGKRSALDVLQDILEGPPRPVGELARGAPAELVAICERAMARRREDRYRDMAALADDVRAFLENRVVSAYEAGAWAEARKWIRRNRPLAVSFAAGLLALVVGLVASLILMEAADASAKEAAREARVSDEVNAFLNDDLFAAIDPTRLGVNVTVRELLDVASQRLDGRFIDEPIVEGNLRATLGSSFRRVGQYEESESNLRRAVDLLDTSLAAGALDPGDRRPDAARLELVRTLAARGRTREALELVDATVPRLREADGDGSDGVLSYLGVRGGLLDDLGRLSEARAQLTEVADILQARSGPDHPDTLEARSNLALTLRREGKQREATELLRAVLDRRRGIYGDGDFRVLQTVNNLSIALASSGDYEEAESLSLANIDRLAAMLGEAHPHVGEAKLNLGILYLRMSRTDEAERWIQEARSTLLEQVDEDHPLILEATNSLAIIRSDQGRMDEALELRRDAVERHSRTLGPDHPNTIRVRSGLAVLLSQMERFEESLALHEEVLASQRRAIGEDHPTTLVTLENLGGLYFRTGDVGASLEVTNQVLEARRRVLGEGHPDVAKTTFNLGMVLKAQGDMATAEATFVDTVERMRVAFGDENALTAEALHQLGNARMSLGRIEGAMVAYEASLEAHLALTGKERIVGYLYHQVATCKRKGGDFEGAVGFAEPGLELRREVLGSDDESTLSTMRELFTAHVGAGQFDEAEPLVLEFHDRVEALHGAEHADTARARGLVADLYESWGRPEEARLWRD